MTPEHRTKYFVEHDGVKSVCWFMGGLFIFDNYRTETDVKIIQCLGNERQYFGTLDKARKLQTVIDKIVNKS